MVLQLVVGPMERTEELSLNLDIHLTYRSAATMFCTLVTETIIVSLLFILTLPLIFQSSELDRALNPLSSIGLMVSALLIHHCILLTPTINECKNYRRLIQIKPQYPF